MLKTYIGCDCKGETDPLFLLLISLIICG